MREAYQLPETNRHAKTVEQTNPNPPEDVIRCRSALTEGEKKEKEMK